MEKNVNTKSIAARTLYRNVWMAMQVVASIPIPRATHAVVLLRRHVVVVATQTALSVYCLLSGRLLGVFNSAGPGAMCATPGHDGVLVCAKSIVLQELPLCSSYKLTPIRHIRCKHRIVDMDCNAVVIVTVAETHIRILTWQTGEQLYTIGTRLELNGIRLTESGTCAVASDTMNHRLCVFDIAKRVPALFELADSSAVGGRRKRPLIVEYVGCEQKGLTFPKHALPDEYGGFIVLNDRKEIVRVLRHAHRRVVTLMRLPHRCIWMGYMDGPGSDMATIQSDHGRNAALQRLHSLVPRVCWMRACDMQAVRACARKRVLLHQ